MTKTYTAPQIAVLLGGVTLPRVYALARDNNWSYQLIEAEDSGGHMREIRHYDADLVDAYLSSRTPQPKPSGYPQQILSVAASDEEIAAIKEKLTTRERATKLLKDID